MRRQLLLEFGPEHPDVALFGTDNDLKTSGPAVDMEAAKAAAGRRKAGAAVHPEPQVRLRSVL